MATEQGRGLMRLHDRAERLKEALQLYQRALLAAREEGASWAQMGQAASLSKGGARGQHRVAQEGGEMHIRLEPLKEES